MAKFAYLGRDNNHKIIEDEIEATTVEEATTKLSAQGINLIKITALKRSMNVAVKLPAFLAQRISKDELQLFCRQMQTLLGAGVPILRSIEQLSTGVMNKNFQKCLKAVGEKIKAGSSLSVAMSAYPRYFSDLFISVIKVGEKSGNLDDAFAELFKYIELESTSRKRVIAAVRYPTIVIVAIILAIVLLSTMVVPQFAKMFASFKSELPLPTIILLQTSYVITNYWYMFFIIVLAAFVIMKYALRTHSGLYAYHYIILKIPLLGKTFYKILLSRFCRLLALLIKSSIPILEGLELTSKSLDNLYMSMFLDNIMADVEEGSTLSTSMRQYKIFPLLMVQMLQIGEETGNLEHMLTEVAKFYEREADYELEKIGEAVEPVMLIVVGGLVLMLALGIFLPMWDMVSFAKGGK
jgi:MSHA biogenesis protein MshG